MKLFVDTNLFVAATVDEPGRGQVATDFLNSDYDFCTSVLNLMEFRTVLAKKKQVEQAEVESLIDDITDDVNVYFPDIEDFVDAYQLQQETLLYPQDCLVLSTANSADAALVTFDAELLDNGARPPGDFLDENGAAE